ncbi:MAG: T9SS type A sorting domain-containing protein, partial [Bacteroidales bacterium]
AIGQIVGTDISVKVKVGTPINALVATFTISDKASAYVGSTLQVSNVTRNDFTNPVIYRVFAEDGSYFDYTVTVTFNTGIEETEWLNSIKAYPNPVADRLTIEMTRPADRIQVINALGQGMEDIQNAGQSTVVIPTASWMKGIYFVRYYLDNKFIGVQKLIKE